jgi:hypothetical protein
MMNEKRADSQFDQNSVCTLTLDTLLALGTS